MYGTGSIPVEEFPANEWDRCPPNRNMGVYIIIIIIIIIIIVIVTYSSRNFIVCTVPPIFLDYNFFVPYEDNVNYDFIILLECVFKYYLTWDFAN